MISIIYIQLLLLPVGQMAVKLFFLLAYLVAAAVLLIAHNRLQLQCDFEFFAKLV